VAYNFLEKSSSDMERTNVDVFLAGIEKAFRYPLDIYTSIKAASESLLETSDHKNIQKQLAGRSAVVWRPA
jgi:hypothetical protein